MINGQINFQSFQFAVIDGEGQTRTGQKIPAKILTFKDANGGLVANFIFSEKEFELFIEKLRGGNIVLAKNFPTPPDLKIIPNGR